VLSYGGECARECGVTLVANLKKLAASKLAATQNREASWPINQPPGPPRSGCVQQFAGVNADYVFSSAFAVDTFGGAAQLLSLGIITPL
jgi:hypothetical protein